jgi:hypothetical protein
MSGYIWFSFGSDTTGPKLAKALGFSSGKKTPNPQDYDVVIGWGCKAGEKYSAAQFQQGVEAGQLRVLNSPEAISGTKDKLQLLARLREFKVSAPGFVPQGNLPANQFLASVLVQLNGGGIDFPLVLLHHLHKGDPTFFHTREELSQNFVAAVREGQHYVRSLCPGDEYRIHVLRDMAILAQRKTPAKDQKAALISSLKGSLLKRAEKAGMGLTADRKAGIDFAVQELAPEILRGPSQLLRSVDRGWSLEDCDLRKVPEHAVIQAIGALDAAGLDLGAVSLTVDGKVARVTNVTSSPALSDEHVPIYAAAISDFCKAKPSSKKNAAAKKGEEEDAPPELLALLSRTVKSLGRKKAEALLRSLSGE